MRLLASVAVNACAYSIVEIFGPESSGKTTLVYHRDRAGQSPELLCGPNLLVCFGS
jgi:RecA/RadA recombinase